MSEESTRYYFDLHQYFETIFVAANNRVVVDSKGRIGCNWQAKLSIAVTSPKAKLSKLTINQTI